MLTRDDMKEVVARLRRHGLPKPKRDTTDLSEELKNVLEAARHAMQAAQRLDDHGKGDLRNKKAFREAQQAFRDAVYRGLLDVPFIQENAPIVGAIPSPQTDFRYYREFDGSYRCWECDAEVLAKVRHMSIHNGPAPGSGFGEVEQYTHPYCPQCEPEPPDHGFTNRPWGTEKASVR